GLRLAAGVAPALLGLRLRHRLDVSAEILPSHHLLDRLQRIALGADRLQPTLNIEKPLLPMTRSLHPPISACAHRVRFVGTWREEFFEAPKWQKASAGRFTRSMPAVYEGQDRTLPPAGNDDCSDSGSSSGNANFRLRIG